MGVGVGVAVGVTVGVVVEVGVGVSVGLAEAIGDVVTVGEGLEPMPSDCRRPGMSKNGAITSSRISMRQSKATTGVRDLRGSSSARRDL